MSREGVSYEIAPHPPAQRPPPSDQEMKHNVKKNGTVWMKLHKDGDNWKIVAVSDKQLSM